jgi:hypothetical protein
MIENKQLLLIRQVLFVGGKLQNWKIISEKLQKCRQLVFAIIEV